MMWGKSEVHPDFSLTQNYSEKIPSSEITFAVCHHFGRLSTCSSLLTSLFYVFFQALKLIFNTFQTHSFYDYLEIWDASGTEPLSYLYGTQTNRPDIIVHSNAAYLTFKSNNGGEQNGFDIKYQCYNLTTSGKYMSPVTFLICKVEVYPSWPREPLAANLLKCPEHDFFNKTFIIKIVHLGLYCFYTPEGSLKYNFTTG